MRGWLDRVEPLQLISAIIISLVASAVLGYQYALTTQAPRVEVVEVGVLNGTALDVPVLFNGNEYKCDLELHMNPQQEDSAVCEPVTSPRRFPRPRK